MSAPNFSECRPVVQVAVFENWYESVTRDCGKLIGAADREQAR